MKTRGVASASAVALFVARSVLAQAPTQDPAAAAELFRQGRAALEQKDYAVACPALRESLRLDVHVGTLISLAVCEEATGKLASARLHWQLAANLARGHGDERAEYCAQQLAAIDKRVPRPTIHIARGAASGTYVRKDGVDVGGAGIDVALPLEVGAHQIVALAPHHDSNAYPIDAKEGERYTLNVEPGAALPFTPAPEDLPPTEHAVLGATRVAPNAGSPSIPLRGAAYVAGAFGVVGIGIGAYFGLRAIAGSSGSPGHCTGDVCDHAGVTTRRGAIDAGNASTLAFVAGGVLVATGVVFFIASRPSGTGAPSVGVAPTVAPNAGSLSVTGSW